MQNRGNQTRTVGAYLFNPFRFIAGMESLLLGLFAIGLAGFLGAHTNTHFDGVIDAHTGAAAPMWCFLAEGFISWICMAVVLLVFGKIASKTSFRIVDLFGTQALARWPTVIVAAACLLPGYTRFTDFITWHFTNQGDQVDFATADAVAFSCVILLILAVICWIAFLMYKSYSVSCNVSGGKAVGTFVVAIILGEILSKVAIVPMLLFVQQDQSWKPRKAPIPERLTYQYEQAYGFEDSSGIEIVNEDEGLSASVTNGEVRIVGETTDRTWKSDGAHVRFDDKLGDMEVSGSFRIEEKSSSGLVFLELAIDQEGPVIIMFQWAPLFEGYQIQDAHLNMNTTIESEIKTVGPLGDEDIEFNTMTIALPESRMYADFFVNDTYIDRLLFSEKLGEVQSMRLAFQTPRKGKKYDIRLDDLTMRWNDSPAEQRRVRLLKESGGLVLHYTFDETGEGVADVSGQDYPGKLKGGAIRTNGVSGMAMLFRGKGDYVVAPETRRLIDVQDEDYTLAAWFRPDDVPDPSAGGYAMLVKAGCHLGLWYNQDQQFMFSHWFRSVPEEIEVELEGTENIDGIATVELRTPVCAPGRWHHVCGVASKTKRTLTVYLDGEEVGSREWTAPWHTLNYHSPWRMGRASPGSAKWRMGALGSIDDVRIYNRALSAEEIETIYREAFPDGEMPVAAVPSEIEKLETGAAAGDMHAQMALSWKCDKGEGVPKDLIRARKLRELAADQGHPNAETARANEYKEKGEFEKALIWYRRAGEHGDAMGFYYAGDLYFHGKGTEQDYAKARKLFERGYQMKNQYCASSLTVIYTEGKGVPKDSDLAAKYWCSAAEFGLGVAQLNMGDQCKQGGDIEGAREWYRKAAAQGDKSAEERLRDIGEDAQ